MEEKTIKLPPAQLAIVNAKPFSIPYFKKHPYAGWLKAVESFVSDDETRFLLQHVCPVMYKNPVKKDAETCLHLVATNGHIGIALDLSDLPAARMISRMFYLSCPCWVGRGVSVVPAGARRKMLERREAVGILELLG